MKKHRQSIDRRKTFSSEWPINICHFTLKLEGMQHAQLGVNL